MLVITIISIFFAAITYLFIRNNRVYKFRISIMDEDYKKTCEEIAKGNFYYSQDQYDRLPSYNSMIFSFKKLTKENWLKM